MAVERLAPPSFEDWQAENRRLTAEGWQLVTYFMLNGSTEHYAEKDGVQIRRDPPQEQA